MHRTPFTRFELASSLRKSDILTRLDEKGTHLAATSGPPLPEGASPGCAFPRKLGTPGGWFQLASHRGLLAGHEACGPAAGGWRLAGGGFAPLCRPPDRREPAYGWCHTSTSRSSASGGGKLFDRQRAPPSPAPRPLSPDPLPPPCTDRCKGGLQSGVGDRGGGGGSTMFPL